ncbi:MAG TPA: Gfo/Idh/MocA family oxidoreductase [Candidatus Gallacutalibacter stercoravium]|nr:Gfo/Idh/MocA family oxidoreductase [Candidatus Gallacutalibacter stercoravium]
MREVKVGIIGCGGIANGKHMPSLKKLSNVKMVAFCDIIEERAQKAKEEYGTPDAKVFTDYRDLLKMEEIEVVHVLTPNVSHAELSIAALEAGKHVMCEKPMAATYKDAKAMVDAAKRTGKKLTIGYQTRSTQAYQYARKLIADGELGDIYYVKAPAIRRRGAPLWGVFLDKEKQGGGPMIDIGTHSIDAALYLIGNYEVESVTGSVYRKLADTAMYSNEWGIWDPKDFQVEDSAMGYIKFKNGATMVVEASWVINMVDGGCTTICGTGGGIEMRGDTVRINGEKNGSLFINEVKPNSTARELFKGENLTPEEYEAKQWIYSIVNDTEPLTKPEEACVVSHIIEAIYESAATGKTIYFD